MKNKVNWGFIIILILLGCLAPIYETGIYRLLSVYLIAIPLFFMILISMYHDKLTRKQIK